MAQPTYDRNAAIRGILTVVTAATIDPEKRQCDICIQQMNDADESTAETSLESPPVKLPCPHIYHLACITPWLETSATCPTCREQVLPFPAGSNLDLGTWRRSRERYFERLSERHVEGLMPRGAHDNAAREAFLFLTAVTDEYEVPCTDLLYIADAVSNMPEFLTHRRFRSARFYDDCGSRRQLMDYGILARLIREDLDDIDND